MNTSNSDNGYNIQHDELIIELVYDLLNDDRRQLHAILKSHGLLGWLVWLESHGEQVAQFLMKSPMMRNRRENGVAETRLLLRYGAIVSAQISGKMAHWFHDPALYPDWPNKLETRAARGELLWRAIFENWDPWPFDEPAGLGSPF